MPYYEKPRSDAQQVALLQQATTVARLGDPETGERGHLSQATINRLERFVPGYAAQVQQLQATDAAPRGAWRWRRPWRRLRCR
ncbi:MAG: hypothetical protein R2932_56645 [Caldilineaceae bacterium]